MSVHRFRAMGCEVVVAGATPGELVAVESLFARYEGEFSRFVPGSELNRVNGRAGRTTLLSPLFAELLETALGLAAASEGLVDPTLGCALEAAGYTRDFAQLPADGPPAGPGSPGCWRSLRLAGRLLFLPPGVRLDLNGVVKSSAVDAALRLLAGDGFVSAGGDLAARGPLDVALPDGGAVRLVRGGLATSGRTVRRWVCGGREQHHLIDPATGGPSTSPWEQVTVCGASCLVADVAAKAAFLQGAAGPDWLAARGLAGRFAGEGGVVCNEPWRRSVEEPVACT